jgi:predicted signal transduction protein with EAL and GGDEF domain
VSASTFSVLQSSAQRRRLLLALVAAAAVAILQIQPPGLQLLAMALLLLLLLVLPHQLRASAPALSQIDSLTGLPNRPNFLEQIDLAAARGRRSGKPFAVLFLDIDQFRSLNDTYGHATGDPVLIAVAERYRLMRELGDQIFALSLQGFSAIRTALNMPELHERLATMRSQAGIPAQLITLEITEASILERNPATEANPEQFRRQGYRLALDDFGTGYSSLSLLSTLRPDEIKIDKSFVMGLGSDAMAGQIVAVVAGLARQMNLQLVAEGVENAEVLAALQTHGIGLFQGYHFHRPQPAEGLSRRGARAAGTARSWR